MANHSKSRGIVRPLVAVAAALAVVGAGGPSAVAPTAVAGDASTSVSASILKDISDLPTSRSEESAVMGGHLYVATSDEMVSDLWRSDGTTAGTARLRRFHAQLRSLTACGSLLF